MQSLVDLSLVQASADAPHESLELQLDDDDETEVTIALHPEAAQDLTGPSCHLLRTAMRGAGVIITIQHGTEVSHDFSYSNQRLTIQGTRRAINATHRYLGRWAAGCQQHIVAQLSTAMYGHVAHPQVPSVPSDQAQQEQKLNTILDAQKLAKYGQGPRRNGATAIIYTKTDLVANSAKSVGAMLGMAYTNGFPTL